MLLVFVVFLLIELGAAGNWIARMGQMKFAELKWTEKLTFYITIRIQQPVLRLFSLKNGRNSRETPALEDTWAKCVGFEKHPIWTVTNKLICCWFVLFCHYSASGEGNDTDDWQKKTGNKLKRHNRRETLKRSGGFWQEADWANYLSLAFEQIGTSTRPTSLKFEE